MKTTLMIFVAFALVACGPGETADSVTDDGNVGGSTVQTAGTSNSDRADDTDGAETCKHWHYPQDYKYGEDCWAPPVNLCRNGMNDSMSWYCSPDGTQCCITYSSNCFFCGWVECLNGGNGVSEACAAFELSQEIIDCGNSAGMNCTQEAMDMMLNPEICNMPFTPNDPQHTYCWDEYVEPEETEPCNHWHYPADKTYGENCWEPPENLCRDAITEETSWYCNSDGTQCCITPSSSCFLCGWINCYNGGNGVSEACAAFNLSQEIIDCGNSLGENCTPEAEEMMYNPQSCLYLFNPRDPKHMYCWDEYVND